ncbi:probable BOI-related E3 ubiquitin-protein ligase 3 [Impatiens glandulifera]|uniref:probable BOI-related E3 ubiquitin-protein ligase 3 n=1 Tax=Impatiens glandulifera TaxID=253017 RepID=UPI001FB05BB6|nr:probable BOI-related E3 ubiquitin-protein ligase 3 [Impatiens glandulifera]
MFMAVEAQRSIFCNAQMREMMMMNGVNENMMNTFNNVDQIGFETDLVPIDDSSMARAAAAAGGGSTNSGLTCNFAISSRKRSRTDSFTDIHQFTSSDNNNNMYSQIHQQQYQFEVDRIIALHSEKLRLDMEERRKKYARRIVAVVEEGMMKTLKSKEEEIENIGKLNWVLEEKVKSLMIENQIWRELAQANEATANALRSNLDQVLAKVRSDDVQTVGGPLLFDHDDHETAESCCGSNFDYDNEGELVGGVSRKNYNSTIDDRVCKCCGEMESCVLVLPCRHLCLCTVCGSSVHICPVCNSIKNASVHVNFS